MKRKPLVSVIIPNYNHSLYLEGCLESILNQTYDNIEVIILDNCSSDNSIEILKKYNRIKNVTVNRNPFNIFSHSYLILSDILAKGDYIMMVPADDYISSTLIEKGISIMETYPNVGYVHVEKDFLSDENKLIVTDPFYYCSFIANGEEVMPVYMMTTVAHAAQGIIRRSAFDKIKGYKANVIDYANVDKSLWFYLSSVSDYAYIKDKMAVIRIGKNTDTSVTQSNMQHPMLTYLTIRSFVDFARNNEFPKVVVREEEALYKLAKEYLDIASVMIFKEDYLTAERYLDFSKIVSRKIENDEKYNTLRSLSKNKEKYNDYITELKFQQYGHKRSYNPPNGYIEINS